MYELQVRTEYCRKKEKTDDFLYCTVYKYNTQCIICACTVLVRLPELLVVLHLLRHSSPCRRTLCACRFFVYYLLLENLIVLVRVLVVGRRFVVDALPITIALEYLLRRVLSSHFVCLFNTEL